MPMPFALLGGTPDGSSPSFFVVIVPYLLILLIFYFLLIRPQQKRVQAHRRLVESLKKGDDVVTESGLYGTVVGIQDEYVVLKVAENVKVRFLKAKVSGRVKDLGGEKPAKT
jgi:preprotein translocase subunit YajC